MTVKTMFSAALLGLSGAALAQVAVPADPKLGNDAAADTAAPANAAAGNGADPAANSADPGKR